MIHYMYTTFWWATQDGGPILRPMWFEFPDETDLYTMDTQFMFGESMLVAPKISPPGPLSEWQEQEVNFYLPKSATWYNYYTKQVEETTGTYVNRNLTDLEQAVFVRGGAVLPILLHENCTALTNCFFGKIRLEVYLDGASKATGHLYLDDGETMDYKDPYQQADVRTDVDSNGMRSYRTWDSKYEIPHSQVVEEIAVYGMAKEPKAVHQHGAPVKHFTFENGVLKIEMPGGVSPESVDIKFAY